MDLSSAPVPSHRSSSAAGRLAGRVGSHTAIYALTAGTSVIAGLVSVVVLTRYLAPGSFGKLAVLLAMQSLLMLVYNAGSLQGTLSWLWGATGDEEDDGDDAARPGAHDRRRALTTGLLMTTVAVAIGTLVVAVLAGPIAGALLGDPRAAGLVVLAAAGAAPAAVWRLASNVLRLERRPWRYLTTAGAQHLLGLAVTIPLVIAGRGVGGALAGIAIGNAAALCLALWLIRGSVRRAASWADAKAIARRGWTLVPLVVSVHLVQLADVLILSSFVPNAQVGLYRIASRIGALVTYWTSSFYMAWGPLRRDAVHLAADAEVGRGRMIAVLSTYFVLVTAGALLAATVLADVLIRLAAPAYTGAASLIPLTAAGFACHGVFVLAYRTADFHRRRAWFVALTVSSAAVFAGATILLVPVTGPSGAALGIIIGWLVGTIVMLARGQLGARPVPFEWGRMAAGVLIAGACAAAGRVGPDSLSAASVARDLAALVAYPVLLVGLRIVPWSHVRALLAAIARPRRGRSAGRNIAELEPEHP